MRYKSENCPKCGAPSKQDHNNQSLTCEYCGEYLGKKKSKYNNLYKEIKDDLLENEIFDQVKDWTEELKDNFRNWKNSFGEYDEKGKKWNDFTGEYEYEWDNQEANSNNWRELKKNDLYEEIEDSEYPRTNKSRSAVKQQRQKEINNFTKLFLLFFTIFMAVLFITILTD